MENAKTQFARNIQALATTVAQLSNQFEDVAAVYNARQYGPGAADPFTDLELEQLEGMGGRKMTADQVYAFVIFCDQFKNFMSNGVPAQRDYSGDINKIRTDL